MLGCTVTLSANAGISLEWHGHKIWIDALHTGKIPGYSTLSPQIWAQMQMSPAFVPPELICFTHCHPDHYSRSLTTYASTLWPHAKLILPQEEFHNQILLAGNDFHVSLGDVCLRFLRLPHEGRAFSAVPHYGILLSDGASRILISGDCEVASPALTQYLDRPVDLAVLSFPWLTLHRGQLYIRDVLRPRRLLLYHLPFPEDDTDRYLCAVKRAALRQKPQALRLLSSPLQQEIFS